MKIFQQAQVLNRHKSTNKALKKDDKPETRSTEINRFKSTQSIASTIGLMTAAFYICWTPYAVRCIIELVGYSLPPIVYTLTILFAKLGVVINPILYIFYNKVIIVLRCVMKQASFIYAIKVYIFSSLILSDHHLIVTQLKLVSYRSGS